MSRSVSRHQLVLHFNLALTTALDYFSAADGWFPRKGKKEKKMGGKWARCNAFTRTFTHTHTHTQTGNHTLALVSFHLALPALTLSLSLSRSLALFVLPDWNGLPLSVPKKKKKILLELQKGCSHLPSLLLLTSSLSGFLNTSYKHHQCRLTHSL